MLWAGEMYVVVVLADREESFIFPSFSLLIVIMVQLPKPTGQKGSFILLFFLIQASKMPVG